MGDAMNVDEFNGILDQCHDKSKQKEQEEVNDSYQRNLIWMPRNALHAVWVILFAAHTVMQASAVYAFLLFTRTRLVLFPSIHCGEEKTKNVHRQIFIAMLRSHHEW